jgi:dihydrofolate reductase
LKLWYGKTTQLSLVDELHLIVYPVTRGSGPRLFTDDSGAATWSLAALAAYDNGVLYLNYTR